MMNEWMNESNEWNEWMIEWNGLIEWMNDWWMIELNEWMNNDE